MVAVRRQRWRATAFTERLMAVPSPHGPDANRHNTKATTVCCSIIAGKFATECYHFGMLTAGFVLVGGRSTRMGRDKALLPWNSAPLVKGIAASVQAAAGSVNLIGDPARYGHLGYDCLPDSRPGFGPLAGIETALASRRGELNLITACDMPGLERTWLRSLLESAAQSDALCTLLVDSSGIPQPLCAVYRSACLPRVQAALQRRQLKLRDFVDSLPSHTLTIPAPVFNVNTPEEWAAWQRAGTQ